MSAHTNRHTSAHRVLFPANALRGSKLSGPAGSFGFFYIWSSWRQSAARAAVSASRALAGRTFVIFPSSFSFVSAFFLFVRSVLFDAISTNISEPSITLLFFQSVSPEFANIFFSILFFGDCSQSSGSVPIKLNLIVSCYETNEEKLRRVMDRRPFGGKRLWRKKRIKKRKWLWCVCYRSEIRVSRLRARVSPSNWPKLLPAEYNRQSMDEKERIFVQKKKKVKRRKAEKEEKKVGQGFRSHG